MARDINITVERIFRENYRSLFVLLVKSFGTVSLDEIDNAIQGAMEKALIKWSKEKIPNNPVGWILTVSKNILIDELRHQTQAHHKKEIIKELHAGQQEIPIWLGPLDDEILKMIFVVSHPNLTRKESIVIALRLVCDLDIQEIARGLASPTPGIQKTLTTAKKKIKAAAVPFEVPKKGELQERLQSALQIIYLLFNEGYSATKGDRLTKQELANEAIRLLRLLEKLEIEDFDQISAMLSLFYLQSARFKARLDQNGRVLRLAEQDRSLWDGSLIQEGFSCLARAMQSTKTSKYHLEAAIAACHMKAKTFQETDWKQILQLYEALVKLDPSPITKLNYIVPVFFVNGPERAIEMLQEIQNEKALKNSYLLPALLGHCHRSQGDISTAEKFFIKAEQMQNNEPTRRFFSALY